MRVKVVPASELSAKSLRPSDYIPVGAKKYHIVIDVEFLDEVPKDEIQEVRRYLETSIDVAVGRGLFGNRPVKKWTMDVRSKDPRKR